MVFKELEIHKCRWTDALSVQISGLRYNLLFSTFLSNEQKKGGSARSGDTLAHVV